ncbi:unnamed protein product [Effrenium voratum]|uniref:Vacuolar protein sorting-associated protein 13 DH-like domain-containing protein n=1 Tax=Effrenium voratum TaxID=2562239 RepID=A0AA36HWX6_9DINO|nr:unnamed protein product [Effrenium voratum]
MAGHAGVSTIVDINVDTDVLPPNSIGAVPVPAFAARQSRGAASAWLTVQLADGCNSAPCQVGSHLSTRLIMCGPLSLVAEPQARAGSLASTISLQPALVFVNALPIGELTLRCTPASSEDWQEIVMPKLSRRNIHVVDSLVEAGNAPCAKESGFRLRLRLNDGPWEEVYIQASAFGHEAFTSTLDLALHDGAPCAAVVEVWGHEVRVFAPFWFIDRSGLCGSLDLDVLTGDKRLPREGGVSLLPGNGLQEHCELLLCSGDRPLALLGLPCPTSWASFFWDTPCGHFALCLQATEVLNEAFGTQSQVFTLRPRLVLTNASDRDLELCLEGRLLRLASGQSQEAHWISDADTPAHLRFRPLPLEGSHDGPWSGLVLCSDAFAGASAFAIPLAEAPEDGFIQLPTTEEEAWTVDVAPDCGALSVSFRQGSNFVACNRAFRSKANLFVHPVGSLHGIAVPLGDEVQYGWREAMQQEEKTAVPTAVDVLVNGRRHKIRDVRRALRLALGTGLVICICRTGKQTVLSLVDEGLDPTKATATTWSQRVEVKLSRIGISLIRTGPTPAELLYWQLELIRAEWRQGSGEPQEMRLSIAGMQVDCQLSGRADRVDRSQGSVLSRSSPPAVIFASHGDGGRAFFSLFLQRAATSTDDLVIPHAELALDAADVTVDDGWLDPLAAFLSQACVSGLGLSTGSAAEVLRLAGKPVVEEYVAPACPRVVQVDALHISPIRLTVWCSMRLRNVVFLPSYVRTAIRLISLSGRFTLDGATLSLPKRSLHPYRGSLGDFLRSLAAEYAVNLLRNIGSVLGRSSFFKVPRVPLKLSGTAVSYVTDGIGLAAGEAAALLNELTFDQEFVERQRHQQGAKQIRGLGDGVVEASKSIAQGVEGLLDVVKKPVQGARSSGLGGFLAGVGMGVAGSFVKPVSRLGQAISDVGSGLAAEVTPDSAPAMRRRARTRQRHPRLLFGPVPCVADLGESGQAPQLRPWSLLEAEVQQLGTDRLQGVQEVVPLTQQTSQVTVLLLFTQHCLVAEIILEAMGNEQALQLMSPARSSTAAPSVPRQRSVRRCNFSDITSVEVDESGDLVELLEADGSRLVLPLFSAPLDKACRAALVSTFRSALLSPDRSVSWSNLSRQMAHGRRQSKVTHVGVTTGPGQRVLEVFEVERRMPGTSDWQTPFLPTEDDLAWRWVDLRGRRHPHLSLGSAPKPPPAGCRPAGWAAFSLRPRSGDCWPVRERTGMAGPTELRGCPPHGSLLQDRWIH